MMNKMAFWTKCSKAIFLFVSLFCGIITVNAQPSSTDIPNPFGDASIIPEDAEETAYFQPGDLLSKLNGTTAGMTLESYGSGGIKAYGISWKYVGIKGLTDNLGSGATRKKYVYFLYAGQFDRFQYTCDGISTYQDAEIKNKILIGDWTLAIAELPDNVTTLNALYFLTKNSIDSENAFYLANFGISNHWYVDPTYPNQAAPMPSSEAFYSVYSDKTGNETTDYNYIYDGWSNTKDDALITPTDKIARIIWQTTTNTYQRARFTSKAPIDPTRYKQLFFAMQHTKETTGQIQLRIEQGTKITSVDIQGTLSKDTWIPVNIVLSDVISLEDGNITSLDFRYKPAIDAPFTTYFDNIIFYTSKEPNIVPSPGLYDENNIVGIYGNYTNGVASETLTDKASDWTNATEVEYEGNKSRRIMLATASTISIKPGNQPNMLVTPGNENANALHLDVWVEQENTNLTISVNGVNYNVSPNMLQTGQWNMLLIPLSVFSGVSTNLSSVSFSGSGTVYLDNIYFGLFRVNIADVAQVGSTNYRTIKEAYEANKSTTGTLEIKVIANSYEPSLIEIKASDSQFEKLIIYPQQECTVTSEIPSGYNRDYLFLISGDFAAEGRSVEINGRINGNGAPRSLILQGKTVADRKVSYTNATVDINASNVTIKDCKFRGQSQFNRPEFTIRMGGYNNEISSNYFENCLFLEQAFNEKNGAVYSISIVHARTSNYRAKNIKINNNHFYETDPIYSKASGDRHFIYYSAEYGTNAEDAPQIIGNKIGGSNRNDIDEGFVGDMLIGMDNPPADALCMSIQFIRSYLPNVGENEANSAGHIRIENNEIAYITIKDHTYEFPTNKNGATRTGLADVTGILATRGLNKIKDNKIHDIKHIAEAPPGNMTGDYFLFGIHATLGENSWGNLICEGNEVYELNVAYSNQSPYSCTFSNIHVQLTSSTKPTAVVKRNRVVMKNNAANLGSSSQYYGIALYLQANNSQSSQIDVYDNIVIINEFAGGAEVASLSGVSNYIDDSNGTINNYNNIIYVQQNSDASFTGSTIINGFRIRTQGENVNLFHNTVFIKEIGSSTNVTRGIYFENANNTKKNSVYNNIIVNQNTNGYVLRSTNKEIIGALDYNIYYGPNERSLNDQSKGFDSWKFDYWGKNEQKDYHSLYQDPEFKSTDDITVFTLENIETLKENLKPGRFLGGEKMSDTFMANSLIDTRTDANNYDIAGGLRRAYLPTIGALNTMFQNYWIGGISSDWSDGRNWGSGSVPGENDEIIFAPMIPSGGTTFVCNRTLVLDSDRAVSHIYNDTDYQLNLNGETLTLTGGIWQARAAAEPTTYAKVNASTENSTIIYNGGLGNSSKSDATQHIFENTFINDKVYDLTLNNESNYFVLLHNKLDIANTLSILNPSSANPHNGALNCIWYNTELKFSGGSNQVIPPYSIYNDEVYDLIVNSEKLITLHDNLFVRNDLEIMTGKKFEVAAGNLVQVDGLTSNNAGAEGLTIKARKNELENTPNATFIFTNAVSDKVPATVEMFSPAKINAGGDYRWQFFTLPVDETPIINDIGQLWGTWIRRWDPKPKNGDANYGTPYWLYMRNQDHLTHEAGYSFLNSRGGTEKSYNLQGYEITMPQPKVIPWKGNLTNQSITVDMEWYEYDANDLNGGTPGEWDEQQEARNGQYVLGNPYTAAVDISKLQFGNGVIPTVYIFTTGSYSEWAGWNTDEKGTGAGQYMAVPINQAGQAGLDRYLSSMQGFVVMIDPDNKTGDKTFTIPYDATAITGSINKNNGIQRSNLQNKKLSTVIDLTSENYSDRLWLFLNSDCKKGYDAGWDGYKFTNISWVPLLFTMEDENTFQVSTMDDIDSTYLGIKSGWLDSTYTLTFQHTGMDQEYEKIELTDLIANRTVDVTETGSTYTFTTTPEDNDIYQRFLLSGKKWETTEPPGEPGLSTSQDGENYTLDTYVKDNSIFIQNTSSQKGVYSLYDISGRSLKTGTFDSNATTVINTSLKKGCYVMKLSTMETKVSKSLIIN